MMHARSMAIVVALTLVVCNKGEQYTEELTITRLASHNLFGQFRFVVQSGTTQLGPHYELFPRILGEVLNKYEVRELHLSLTQGQWRTHFWGLPPQPATPAGAQLYAWFGESENATSVEDRWNHLVNSLNGIFCTSLLQLITLTTSSPTWSFRPRGLVTTADPRFLRYGIMSGENVCTENLTPWKKLLPCKQSGLSLLLNPMKLYDSLFHSMSVNVLQTCQSGDAPCRGQWRLELNVNVVFDYALRSKTLLWNLNDLFGSRLHSKCEMANSSVIVVERDQMALAYEPSAHREALDGDRHFLIYDVQSLSSDSMPFNLHVQYKSRLDLDVIPRESLVDLHSFLGGTDQQSGEIIHRILNHQDHPQRALFAHIVPWFLLVYYHSIEIRCATRESPENEQDHASAILARHFVSGVDRGRPYLIELDLLLPAQSVCHLSYEFDKAFLRTGEFPPDANRGLNAPSASLTIRADQGLLRQNRSVLGGYRTTTMDELASSTLDSRDVLVLWGDPLLVFLAVPDFSMPFNVICLVCTAIAMCFGPVHSLTTKILMPVDDEALLTLTPLQKLYVVVCKRTPLLRDWMKRRAERQLEAMDEAARKKKEEEESNKQCREEEREDHGEREEEVTRVAASVQRGPRKRKHLAE